MHAGPTSPLRRALVVLATATLALAAACSGDDAPPAAVRPEGSRIVRFPAAGGSPQLAGTLTGKGRAGVILAHQYNADQSAWYAFAAELASKGYTVLTFNFRGFCPGDAAGCSDGKQEPAQAALDLEGAITFMQNRGVDKLFIVGASMGGTVALVPMPLRVDGIVAVSAPEDFEGLKADTGALPKTPMLFVAGREDPADAAGAARRLYDAAPKPKQILVVPSEEHGAYLLDDPTSGEEVRQAILRFLDLYRSAA